MKKYFFIGFLFLFGLSIFGQNHDRQIDSVTIVKRLKEKEQKLITVNSQPTSLLSLKELNRNNPALIEQSMNTIPGVQMQKRTNVGGQKIILRGYGNDQRFNNWGIKVYLNNVPLTNAEGVTILEDIDFSQLTSLQVIKGPASTKYGGGVGGVVQFFMEPSIQNGTFIQEKMILGSFNHFQTQTRVNTKTDKSSVSLTYNHLESDGYRPWSKSLRNNYAFSGYFKLNNKQSIEIYAAHNNSYEQVAGQISYQDYYAGKDPGNSAYIDRGSGNKLISNRAFITHHWNIFKGLDNQTSIFTDYLDTKRIASGAYEKSGRINYGLRSVFDYTADVTDDITSKTEAGVEYMTSNTQISNYRFTKSATHPLEVKPIKKASYFDYENLNYSVFLTERLTYHPLDLSLALGLSANKTKYNREDLLALEGLVEGYDKNLSFHKIFETTYTPHIALQKSWRNQIFNLSYSEGFSSPTASYSLGNKNAATDVNDDLKVENAQMWDFTAQGFLINSLMDYQVSLFNMKIKNKILPFKTPDYTYYVNGGIQNHHGAEFNVGFSLPKLGNIIKKIRPFISYAFYDFKYKNFKLSSEDFSGNRVVGVPKNQYSLGIDFTTDFGLYLSQTYTYKGEVYADFKNVNLVKGFGLYNAKLGYEKSFGKWNLDVFLMGNNLTDSIHYTFLFTGNAQKNGDDNSNYANVETNIIPGYKRSYYFYGFNLKYSIF